MAVEIHVVTGADWAGVGGSPSDSHVSEEQRGQESSRRLVL